MPERRSSSKREQSVENGMRESSPERCFRCGGSAGGTMSADGRVARDVMLGLSKTCRKLGLSFFTYLGDRLGLNTGQPRIPPLAILVARAA